MLTFNTLITNSNYQLVQDICTNKESNDIDVFTSQQCTINDKSYFLINSYNNIVSDKCVGVWETILTNNIFDFSDVFKCRFVINNNTYTINNKVDSIEFGVNAKFITLEEYSEVSDKIYNANIENINFIKTPAQINKEEKSKNQKIIFNYVFIYTIIASLLLWVGYNAYQNHSVKKVILENLIVDKQNLEDQLHKITKSSVKTNDANINKTIGLLIELNTHIDIVSANIKFNENSNIAMIINNDYISAFKVILQKHNFKIEKQIYNAKNNTFTIVVAMRESNDKK